MATSSGCRSVFPINSNVYEGTVPLNTVELATAGKVPLNNILASSSCSAVFVTELVTSLKFNSTFHD